MKKALILYYSQAGQTRTALEALAQGMGGDQACDIKEIQPRVAFPFPWKMAGFFRVFPQCVAGLGSEILPLNLNWDDYDLVILGYQVWFLSPSLPMQGFLQSKAALGLKGKKIITVLTCRNLWQSASRRILEHLERLGAEHQGQITLCELSPVWASFVTTPRWMLTGRRGAFAFFPPAGIEDREFAKLHAKGQQIQRCWERDGEFRSITREFSPNRTELSFFLMDWIGYRFFKLWSLLILRLAPRQGLWQDLVLIVFRLSLIVLILVVAPCTRVLQALLSGKEKSALRIVRT